MHERDAGLTLRLDPELLAECVLQGIEKRSPEEQREFRRERDAIYEVDIVDIREASFRELDTRWWRRLGIADRIRQQIDTFPSIPERVSDCLVVRARTGSTEGADLYARGSGDQSTDNGRLPPVLIISLRPETLLDPERLQILLCRELMHVADILDPSFEYEPDLPALPGGASVQNLVRERYRLLWDITVDGRLEAMSMAAADAKDKHKQTFRRVFPMLASCEEEVFEKLFSGPRPSHPELIRFAIDPGGGQTAVGQGPGNPPPVVCVLCESPSTRWQSGHGSLSPDATLAVRGDFPRWQPTEAVCIQCADLYEARVRDSRQCP